MNRLLPIFYAVAIAFHAAVLFWLKPPAPRPPKIVEKTFIDVALTAPPPEPPKVQAPPPVVPPPKVETPPPKPEPKPEPVPLPPEPVMTIPEPKPEPPPPKPVAPPVVIPPPQPPDEYVQVAEPKYATRAEPIYPTEARRRHQQGIVRLELFISELGALDKIEIVKSSGFPLLDAAAIKAMRQSQFDPAMSGAIKIRSRAEATVTFRLE
ncbi:MAG TPA: energy transducer TonB [Verrucomicrobiae bacterium]|jgi:protein TonB